jgi:hypothetical protein
MDTTGKSITETKSIAERSGNVKIINPLTEFLYILMRDHVTPGVVEKIMTERISGRPYTDYSNGWLALYADDVAKRLYTDQQVGVKYDDLIEHIKKLMPLGPLVSVTSECQHEYPNPWHGTIPPPCMKCGKIAELAFRVT